MGVLGTFAQRMIDAYVQPRASARWLLAGGHGFGTAVLLLLLAYLVNSMMTVFLPMPEPDGMLAFLFLRIFGFVEAFVLFLMMSMLVYALGKFAGGHGTRNGAFLVVAWHSLVSSFVMPLIVIAIFPAVSAGGQPGLGVTFLLVVITLVVLWLFANYIAELHGFVKTAWVFMAVLAVGMLLTMVFVMIATRMG